MIRYSLEKFSITGTHNRGAAAESVVLGVEASTLMWPPGIVPDEFEIESHLTGRVETFRYFATSSDIDGDVIE